MTLVTNGRLITRDPEGQGYYEHGAVAYEGTKIVEIGEEAALRAKHPEAEIIDAKGGVIMPALINAHTHIYSALARGLSIVGNNPTNFYEVLDGTWWAIDRHLMMDGTRASATALYIDSIKQGVTTIFDHHASYGEIPGTLHTIAEESKRLGLRSCLCYEVSDRDGEEKCLQAIQENADFITECEQRKDPMLAAMFGGHALFTISDKTFDRMVAANNGKVIAAGWSGKIKTSCTMVGLIAMMILPGVQILDTVVCAVILVTTLYSGFEYFQKNWDVLMPGA